MIRSSLFGKLLVTYLIVIFLFLLILTGLTSLFYNRFFTDFYAHHLLSQAVQLAGIMEAEGIMAAEGRARERMLNAYAGLMGCRVWLLDKEGRLLARSTAPPWFLTLDDKGLRPPRMRVRFRRERAPEFRPPRQIQAGRELLAGGEPGVRIVERKGFPPEDFIAYAPVRQDGEIAGGVVLQSPFAPVRMAIRGNRRFFGTAAFIALIAAVLLSYVLSNRITGPLRKMRRAALDMAEGDFSTRIPVRSRDEVGELAGSFNRLAGELENKISELSREKECITTIITNMSEGVIGIDGGGKVVFANPRAAELLGNGFPGGTGYSSFSRQEGIVFQEFIPHDELQELIGEVLTTGQPRERLLTVAASPRGDSHRGVPHRTPGRVLAVRVEPITTGMGGGSPQQTGEQTLTGSRSGKEQARDGEAGNGRSGGEYRAGAAALSSGCVAVLKDITEEWKYQQMQKEFVANVSHELKTPLALIQGYLEALMDGLTGDPGSEERFLNIIHQETARLIRMVNDLLALAELDRGERKTEPVNLEEVAREMLVLAEKEAARKNLRLFLEIAPEGVAPEGQGREKSEPIIVAAGYNHLAQVILNLLENAVRYSPPSGRIHLRLGLSKASGGEDVDSLSSAEDALAYLSVEDEGCGIPKKELPFIWDRFYRVDKGRSREKGGSGLGLAIVKRIVEFYGGRVSVRSEEGKGSVFSIFLPLAREEKE
ncbi:MAG: cell wall metabolism sensor histidine kinase WalK [Clostridia bacterium]|nr:cell wall metabolism sensor histidine kinase WalK [Clostridia bacterium]